MRHCLVEPLLLDLSLLLLSQPHNRNRWNGKRREACVNGIRFQQVETMGYLNADLNGNVNGNRRG